MTKADLEKAKLEAEIAKLQSETRASDLNVARHERDRRNLEAADDHNHVYAFMAAVDQNSAAHCIYDLTRWSRRDPGCAITVVLNSPGGSVIHGLALYDCITELKAKGHHFTTVTRGYAASMGGILLQAGDHRVIGANAHVLIHEVSSYTHGKFSEMEDDIAFTKRLQNRCLAILAEKSTMTTGQIARKWQRKDWWLDAEQTVALGFADAIG